MIICRDCINYRAYENLEYGNCFHDLQDKTGAHDSCIHAERADGLVECCATCRHIYGECDFLNEALPDVCLNKMLCSEWQPREEK